MEDEKPNTPKYKLPEQYHRSEPVTHHAPKVEVREEDAYSPSQLSRTHLNAHQVIAAGKYIKKVVRNFYEDPSWQACYQQAVDLYIELKDKDDEESILLSDSLKSLFHRTVAGKPQGEENA